MTYSVLIFGAVVVEVSKCSCQGRNTRDVLRVAERTFVKLRIGNCSSHLVSCSGFKQKL